MSTVVVGVARPQVPTSHPFVERADAGAASPLDPAVCCRPLHSGTLRDKDRERRLGIWRDSRKQATLRPDGGALEAVRRPAIRPSRAGPSGRRANHRV